MTEMQTLLHEEKGYRRPAWNDTRGAWITLGDDKEWLFPKPLDTLQPILTTDGYFDSYERTLSLGKQFDQAVAALPDLDPEDGLAFSSALMRLAIIMFKFNYDAPNDIVAPLFNMARMPEGTLLMIARVATGQAPKPSPADGD